MRSAAGSRTSSRARRASGLFDAYLQGQARAFLGAHVSDPADRREAVARAARPLLPGVADAIAARSARLPADPSRERGLELLRGGAAAVVTGQQMGLFLGPLFTLYKTATAVKLAAVLSAETGRPVVPVFWLQDEDHDLPEIASCAIPTASGEPLTVQVPAAAESRVSIAHLRLPPEVDGCLSALRSELGNLPHGGETLDHLARHYRAGARWTDAFAGLLAELFAGHGLVLVDPRDPALAPAAAPVHRRAVEEAAPIAAALAAQARALEDAGFAAAIHVREGSPLSFFHPAGPEGPRFRLEARGSELALVGGEGALPASELLRALDRDPLAFSTSALLRPILQDVLLPTAAYVAGPAELAYFGQLAPLYRAFGIPMPLVAPRARLRILEEKVLRTCSRLSVDPGDAMLGEDELLARCRSPDGPSAGDVRRRLLGAFDVALGDLSPALQGDGLDHAVRKARAAVEHAVEKLAEKHERALLHRDHARVEDVRRLRGWIAPGGVPQERVYGLPYFAARFGDRALVGKILERIDPLDPAPADLHPEHPA